MQVDNLQTVIDVATMQGDNLPTVDVIRHQMEAPSTDISGKTDNCLKLE